MKEKTKSRRRKYPSNNNHQQDKRENEDEKEISWREKNWQKKHLHDQKQSTWRTIFFPQEGKYIGYVNSQGERHGEGILIAENGMCYEGQWKDGLMSGSGVKTFPSGDRYEGHHERGKRSGWGYYLWNSGDKYTGMWENNKMSGYGCFVWACGDVYTGLWKNGIISGKGRKVCADGSSLEGEFKDGTPYGWCVKTFMDGDVFTGTLVGGRREGFGQYKWISGDVYTGMWANDRMHGEGELILGPRRSSLIKSEVLKYRGQFSSGVRQGYGEGLFVSGIQYFGNWNDDKPHGWGTMMYPNGDIGEGDFVHGELSGRGLMIFRSHEPSHNNVANANMEDASNIALTTSKRDPFFTLLIVSPTFNSQPLLKDLKFQQPQCLHIFGPTTFDRLSITRNIPEDEMQRVIDMPLSQIPLRDDLYRGQWLKNFPHGRGVMDFASGNIFLGEFYCGRREGEGTLFRKRNKSVKEHIAESMEEEFQPLGGDAIVAVTKTVDRTMTLTCDAFDDAMQFDKELDRDQNRKYLLHIEQCLQWELISGTGVKMLHQDEYGNSSSYAFSFDIIQGIWSKDRLKKVLSIQSA